MHQSGASAQPRVRPWKAEGPRRASQEPRELPGWGDSQPRDRGFAETAWALWDALHQHLTLAEKSKEKEGREELHTD